MSFASLGGGLFGDDGPQMQSLGGWLADSARGLLADGFTTQCRDWLVSRPARRQPVKVQSLGGWLATGTAIAPGPAVRCCTDPDCPHLPNL
ncbi:hypothetical protein [Yinghuangia seranimata]|uniref:hypothetical protein n=1 Tax=Yinghuangia seranimata TaxID=408067 RepID=UPI00248BBFBC|nr:hypothetical protein [Yinghuangia seranimata]MDI2128751.1 hypothetical protein [Yinghuangia seranimata]